MFRSVRRKENIDDDDILPIVLPSRTTASSQPSSPSPPPSTGSSSRPSSSSTDASESVPESEDGEEVIPSSASLPPTKLSPLVYLSGGTLSEIRVLTPPFAADPSLYDKEHIGGVTNNAPFMTISTDPHLPLVKRVAELPDLAGDPGDDRHVVATVRLTKDDIEVAAPVVVFSVSTGAPTLILEAPHRSQVSGLACSPFYERILTGDVWRRQGGGGQRKVYISDSRRSGKVIHEVTRSKNYRLHTIWMGEHPAWKDEFFVGEHMWVGRFDLTRGEEIGSYSEQSGDKLIGSMYDIDADYEKNLLFIATGQSNAAVRDRNTYMNVAMLHVSHFVESVCCLPDLNLVLTGLQSGFLKSFDMRMFGERLQYWHIEYKRVIRGIRRLDKHCFVLSTDKVPYLFDMKKGTFDVIDSEINEQRYHAMDVFPAYGSLLRDRLEVADAERGWDDEKILFVVQTVNFSAVAPIVLVEKKLWIWRSMLFDD